MSGQRHATVVAACTLALTLTPLIGVFEGLAWTFPVMLTIGIIALTGALIRAAGRGQGLQTLGMAAALLVVLTAGFSGGTSLLLIIPTPATFTYWAELGASGVRDIVVNTPPVAAEGGILFLTLIGVGVVAILHDMFVVGLRTPALAGLTLLTMYLVPVSVAPEATAWFWFVLPAIAYLWILGDDNLRRVSSFGHRFTGTGQLVGQGFPSPLARTARWSAVGFVTATLLALAVVPVDTDGLVNRVENNFNGQGDAYGLGDVNPWAQLSGSLNQPTEVDVLRVTTNDPNPRYLRMHVLDQLTGDGFGPNEYRGNKPLSSLDDDGSSGTVYEAQIENLEMTAPVVPVYGNPQSLDIEGDWSIDADTDVIIGDDTDMGDVSSYTLTYTDPTPEAEVLAAALGMDPGDERWEANTAHPNVPDLTAIVDQELRGANTVHEKVLAVEDFLSVENGFMYSLQTGDAGNDEAILDFLETKRGYCQQFAATMAWMLREADVAARVVIGMSKGSRDGESWVLTSRDYHAWVEVYYEGSGWIPFDPTPASGVPGSVNFPWANEPAEAVEGPSPEPGESAGPTDTPSGATPSAENPSVPEGQDPTAQATADAAGGGSGVSIDPRWLLVVPLLAVPFVPMLLRGAMRRRRLAPDRITAKTAWDETTDLAADFGISLPDTLTPRQAAGVLAQKAPAAREAATRLGSAMALHRYSPRGADPAGLADAVHDLHSELDKAAEPGRRRRARFWPASLAEKLRPGSESEAGSARRSTPVTSRLRAAMRRRRRSNSRGGGSVTGRT
ncbi:transglutaminaseTgpA domain-containing protein [Glycomyces sp. NPDC046736]|uniref:transglutaminase TgpA family protein n=1 Tax=Glycomyces sp. NPDC046736 TaxID=3155615 RepID=UPI00340A99D5